MENAKSNIKKNKTFKKILCYFGLVILNILLFAPMICRIAFKDTKPKTKEDVITILNCEKTDESVRSTFVNDEPINISYNVKGNYEQATDEDIETIINNPVLKKLISYSRPVYNDQTNLSTIKFNVSAARGSLDYEIVFSNITNQEEFFRSNAFSCNRTTQ
jgi:hypothetical protein